MDAVRRDLAASRLNNGGAAPVAAVASSTATGARGGAAAGAALRAGEGDEDEAGCEYELSDDSIEDVEAEAARIESRAK
jgi:hypothetical protein